MREKAPDICASAGSSVLIWKNLRNIFKKALTKRKKRIMLNGMNNRRTFIGLVLAAFLIFGFKVFVLSSPRVSNGTYQSPTVFEDNGDSVRPFSFSVGTTTVVQVYSQTTTATPKATNYASVDRSITLQNTSAFNLWCSTVNTVSASSGNRWVIWGSTYTTGANWTNTTPPKSIFCILDPTAGAATAAVVGWVDYDSGD